MNKIRKRYWIGGDMVKTSKGKYTLTALGAFNAGFLLEKLEWAIATINDGQNLSTYFRALRFLQEATNFEDVGAEIISQQDMILKWSNKEITEEQRTALRDTCLRWLSLMRERLQDLHLATPRSKIDSKKLMNGIDSFLESNSYKSLHKIEISDLGEACKCLLIGSPTAAEHISLRAAENLLRRWYKHKTGKSLGKGTWGVVLDKLVQEYPEKGRPKEITLLGYLKYRRDEVAHPERISTLTEAEATLMNVCSLIEGIQPILAESVAITKT